MHEPGALYVEAAILGDFEQTSLAPPANRIEAGGGFLNAERRVRDRIEPEPVAQPFFHVDHQIGGGKFGDEVEDGVAHQDVVIEVEHVESDDQVRAAQPLDQLVYLRFAEDLIAASRRAESDADRHAHVALAHPAARVVRRPLGFQVEVNNIARHRQISAKAPAHFNSKPPQSKLIIWSTPVARNCSTTAPSS